MFEAVDKPPDEKLNEGVDAVFPTDKSKLAAAEVPVVLKDARLFEPAPN